MTTLSTAPVATKDRRAVLGGQMASLIGSIASVDAAYPIVMP